MRDQAMADDANRRRCVLGDWGTSRLRLFLLEDGAVADTCEGPGVSALATCPGTTRLDTLAGLIAPWATGTRPIRVLLSGMAGSRNGLVEVPYAGLPLHGAAWSRQAATLQTPSLHITIAAGVRSSEAENRPDVMRGEETQIFGAMQLHSALGRASHVAILPGTHSKWAVVSDGSIARFRSAMTGELYALLCDHSTLFKTDGAPALRHAVHEPDRSAGFSAGVARSASLDGGLLTTLFEARAAQLLDDKSPSWATGFLSGLLIGCEIGTMSETFHTAASICIIGDAKLGTLYAQVFATRGVRTEVLDGNQCAIAGLQYLGTRLSEL
jgi:2-dehydro-3-deoxygalactonokinase